MQAIDAQDISAAAGLMAADAALQLEDITNDVARMALAKSSLHVVPDGDGTAHLAVIGSGLLRIVAADGADLEAGSYRFTAQIRRDSRRDEWRVWDFKLQP